MARDLRAAYVEGYEAGRSYLERLDDTHLSAPCPQCPAWTVRDTAAHHVHVLTEWGTDGWPEEVLALVRSSAVEADTEAKAEATRRRDAWTEAGVESFRWRPFGDVLEAWDRAVESMPDAAGVLVTDLSCHLGDIEEALGTDELREHPVMAAGLDRYSWLLGQHLEGRGAEPVALVGHRPDIVAGAPDAEHRITGSSYELLRAVTGRRSRAEADRALDWGSTPERTRAVLPIYDWLDADSGALLTT
ncbi:MAG: hypothetical protein S0880_07720 [Actinomycetota bacterium]|nr:hypothetical protein [Actinomycetota bacterium]